jgi:8-oxo-dGTP diphosphatase
MVAKERFKAVVAVHLLLMKNKQILMYLRQNTGFADGMYSVVAGHIDGGESVTAAMIREAKEEAGIDINAEDLETMCVMHRKAPDREIIDYFIKIEKWKNEIQNLEPEKCKELKFFDPCNIPENTIPYIKAGIECSLKGVKFTEFGWE